MACYLKAVWFKSFLDRISGFLHHGMEPDPSYHDELSAAPAWINIMSCEWHISRAWQGTLTDGKRDNSHVGLNIYLDFPSGRLWENDSGTGNLFCDKRVMTVQDSRNLWIMPTSPDPLHQCYAYPPASAWSLTSYNH